jgi:hypothetical protein
MPHWLKRFLFLLFIGVAAAVDGRYLAPFGFDHVAVALLMTVIFGDWVDAHVLERLRVTDG